MICSKYLNEDSPTDLNTVNSLLSVWRHRIEEIRWLKQTIKVLDTLCERAHHHVNLTVFFPQCIFIWSAFGTLKGTSLNSILEEKVQSNYQSNQGKEETPRKPC